ncbi:MAG: class I SAM-dependent methyltransferase [Actinobacteria bacterium]|nr:class I SAM-dependent methyltransferase [Actinomycetota bacterium]
MTTPTWQWDERVQRGTDYASLEKVRHYDKHMAAIRDVGAEADRILDFLGLGPYDVVLEVGTGTGAFARAAARRCRLAIALDISPAMLTYASNRAQQLGIENVRFQEAGFLTYTHEGEPVAGVVSQLALHHLPDAWKQVALIRLSRLMRPQARLYLSDLVFPDHMADDPGSYVHQLFGGLPEEHHDSITRHISQEFSTFDWAMREMLARAGFVVEETHARDCYLTDYLCHKG